MNFVAILLVLIGYGLASAEATTIEDAIKNRFGAGAHLVVLKPDVAGLAWSGTDNETERDLASAEELPTGYFNTRQGSGFHASFPGVVRRICLVVRDEVNNDIKAVYLVDDLRDGIFGVLGRHWRSRQSAAPKDKYWPESLTK